LASALGAEIPEDLHPGDAHQEGVQAAIPRHVEAGQQLRVIPQERVPDAGRDLVDQVDLLSLRAQQELDGFDQTRMELQVELLPGFFFAVEAAIDQLLVGVRAAPDRETLAATKRLPLPGCLRGSGGRRRPTRISGAHGSRAR